MIYIIFVAMLSAYAGGASLLPTLVVGALCQVAIVYGLTKDRTVIQAGAVVLILCAARYLVPFQPGSSGMFYVDGLAHGVAIACLLLCTGIGFVRLRRTSVSKQA